MTQLNERKKTRSTTNTDSAVTEMIKLRSTMVAADKQSRYVIVDDGQLEGMPSLLNLMKLLVPKLEVGYRKR
jgi:hypothetical protein